MVRWQQKTSVLCPRCGHIETNVHVWTCQAKEAVVLWTLEILKLHGWMTAHDTDEKIKEMICSSLNAWQQGIAITTAGDDIGGVQTTLGWGLVIEGYLSFEWRLGQQRYYEQTGSRRSGMRWAASLVQRLWHITWEM
jgi:hypothetical protein